MIFQLNLLTSNREGLYKNVNMYHVICDSGEQRNLILTRN